MMRKLLVNFNKVSNGSFIRKSGTQANFPEDWLQIAGNQESDWVLKGELPGETSSLEIRNSTASRSGIIQTAEAALDVSKAKEWMIEIILKADSPDRKAYLRIFPKSSKGDVSQPWEYSFNSSPNKEKIKKVLGVSPDIQSLRLETGILGPGVLNIYQIRAHILSPNHMKRRVKRATLKVCQINSIQSIGEIIKPIRLAGPISLQLPLDLQGNAKADVRNLNPNRDKVQIYGSHHVPIATSMSGRVQVEINGLGFYESFEEVTAGKNMASTITRDISALSRCSFAVWNCGEHLAYVQAELSPDGIHWTEEGEPKEIGLRKLVIVSLNHFLRYTRLTYRAEELTGLRIWVQAQN